MSDLEPRRWKYEPDEKPKKKHKWDRPEAGFIKIGRDIIGKCPSTITDATAEHLLNTQAIAFDRNPGGLFPKRLYVVHDGVVYRATPTNAGVSYHAFPELPAKLRELPKKTRNSIIELASRLGCEDEVKRWMNS